MNKKSAPVRDPNCFLVSYGETFLRFDQLPQEYQQAGRRSLMSKSTRGSFPKYSIINGDSTNPLWPKAGVEDFMAEELGLVDHTVAAMTRGHK